MTKSKPLQSLHVAILADDGFEQIELAEPKKALEAAGARTSIVSPQESVVQGWDHDEKADRFRVDVPLAHAKPVEFDALLLPGGVRNPDSLRINPKAVLFVNAFAIAQRPIAAICHGPWLLVEAGLVRGRTVTSWPSLRTDIINGGGTWVDETTVRDGLLLTSRRPSDIPYFNKQMIELFASAGSAAEAARV